MNYVLGQSESSRAIDSDLLIASAIESAANAVTSIEHLLSQGQRSHALNLADTAVRQWPNYSPLLVLAGQLASSAGRLVAAKQLLGRAARLGSSEAAQIRQAIIDEAAPYWHFRMMNDEVRNNAYNQALVEHVTSESIVLDIGCGAGLLSMMAARAGAAHVYTCDVSELMLDTARKIFELNRYKDKITSFHCISNSLKIGKHLPRKADIIVAEVFDSGLLGEKALATFAHARKHLLAPGGKILPGRAIVHAQMIQSSLLHDEVKTYQCAGFDVSPMNELTPSYFQERLNTHDHIPLSSIESVLKFNFEREQVANRRHLSQFHCTEDGLCHGIAFWFTLDFGDGNTMNTSPSNTWNCWKQAVCIFEEPVSVTKNQTILIETIQSADRISFKYSNSN